MTLMKNLSQVIGLIPARGGSKGIPRKNIRSLGGKPLIAWSIEAAKRAKGLDQVIVSSEDPEILEVSKKYGAQVPFVRPIELSADETPGIDPVLHALESLPEAQAIVLLQPTSPFRTELDIDQALKLFKDHPQADSVVSVSLVSEHPAWMYRLKGPYLDPFLGSWDVPRRRQEFEPLYYPNGAIYIAKRETLLEKKNFILPKTLPFVMPLERSLDIDTAQDFLLAESLFSSSALGKS